MAIKFNRVRARLICFFIICTLFFQCTFEPSDVFISPITPPEAISVSFIINDPNFKDPYYLIAPTRLIFRLDNLSNAIIGSDIKLNGKSLNPEINNNRVEFIMSPYGMANGKHTIHMSFKIDTKSGSLANRLGAEFYFVEQSFTVIIDPEPPVFNAFQANIENGYLSMRWSGTSKSNFVYKIKRYLGSGSLPDTIISNPQLNHFIDPGYVGGRLYYKVLATGVGFETLIGSGTIEHEAAEFTLTKNSEGMAQLNWSSININKENVYLLLNIYNKDVKNISVPLTHEGNIDLGTLELRDNISLHVNIYRNGYYSQLNQDYLEYRAPPNIKAFKEYAILKNQNKFLIATDEKLYKYNLEDFSLEDSISLADHGITSISSLIISPDESRALVGSSNKFISFNPNILNEFRYHDLNTPTSKFANPSANLGLLKLGNLSNNGLVSMVIWRGSYYSMLLDINSGEDLWHSTPGNYHIPTISSDGKYFAATITSPYIESIGQVYRRDDKSFEPIGKIDVGGYVFLPDNSEIVIIEEIRHYHEANVHSYSLVNPPQDPSKLWSKVRSVSIPFSLSQSNYLQKITYEPITNHLVLGYLSTLKLMNASNFTFEKSIEGQHLQFSNNYLLHPAGFIEAVK